MILDARCRNWSRRCLLAAGLAVLAAAGAVAEEISGLPFVADGDTLGFGEYRVRLYGIDAPEPDQTCRILGQNAPIGAWATQTLRRLVGRDKVTCFPVGLRRGTHVEGKCHTAGIPDLGRAMVEAGFAWDFRRRGHGIYEDYEAAARKGRLGVWAGETACTPPWDWRRR